jgi:hypothetical protein
MQKGFTIFESIIYVVITSIVVLSLISITWTFINNHTKEKIVMEVNNNASFILDKINYYTNRAATVDNSTVYDANPGTLVITFPTDPQLTINTYAKEVTFGDQAVNITKLQLTQGGSSYDLTSDFVTVDNFVITDLSGSLDTTVQIELTLSYPITSTRIYEYEKSFTSSTTINKK